MLNNPSVEPISNIVNSTCALEIIDIHYDLWLLRVTLNFPDQRAPVYVDFEGVRGFRVLDEGDLLEFWSPDVRVKGWLWHVKSGGWFDLEKTRPGFLSGHSEGLDEYLLSGVNECLSVLAYEPPKIHSLAP